MKKTVQPESKLDGLRRRQFVTLPLAAVVSVPFLAHIEPVAAQEMVNPEDAAAKGLGYVVDATTVDVEKFPKRAGSAGATQFCDNCNFYSDAAATDAGGCTIFPGKLVADKGWCNAWVLKS